MQGVTEASVSEQQQQQQQESRQNELEPTAATVSIPTTVVVLGKVQASGEATNDSNDSTPKPKPILTREAVQIVLDHDEHHMFQTLIQAAEAYEQGKIELPETDSSNNNNNSNSNNNNHNNGATASSQSPRLEIRVAGGWVRDKLLGLQTHDVDIAVNSITGVQFAVMLQRYMQQQKLPVSRIGVIAANPDQSKHLETATMLLDGMDVDFCNLRADEIYAEHSRIPACRFGTPAQDALRRDFHCNALFYNIRTKLVEDWTGRGLRDLLAGELVTPLEPVRTFRDDPLRVLRAIRFAVRYQFKLDPALEAAAVLPEIHEALHLKVSRERVGKELEQMLSGKGANPVLALNMIARLKLAGGVFCVPQPNDGNKVSRLKGHVLGHVYEGDHARNAVVREHGWEESSVLLNLLPTVTAAHVALQILAATNSASSASSASASAAHTFDARLVPVATFLLPFRTLLYEETKKEGKEFSVVSWIFRESIKFKNKDVTAMTTLMDTVDRMAGLLTSYAVDTIYSVQQPPGLCRLDAGMLLRTTKDLWVSSLLLATVVKIRQQQQNQDGVTERHIDWIQISNTVFQTIMELNLDQCWQMKPLMDGKAVIHALDLPRGPQVGTYLDEQMRWMLLNPSGSREECQEHLLSVKRSLEEEGEHTGAECLGKSDGTGNEPSAPVDSGQSAEQCHFSKKLHVENMEL
jgi:tRNA nucleotidyltransferase (CCA-adding enzyme)